MPPLSRRGFLFAALAGASALVAALVVRWRNRWATRESLTTPAVPAPDDDTFIALVDTIVPRDEQPGALDAGIPEQLSRNLANEPWRLEEYREIAAAADAVALTKFGSGFATLKLESRTEVLLQLLRDRQRGNAGRNLAFLRLAVLRRYYASPAGQHMLGYRTPRHGYPDYDRPPD